VTTASPLGIEGDPVDELRDTIVSELAAGEEEVVSKDPDV